jgi:membrane dipeptidase
MLDAAAVRLVQALALLTLAGCGATRPLAAAIPPAVASPTVVVDLHLHVAMSRAANPLFKGEPGDGILSWNASERLVNQIDEKQLHAAGLRLALGSVWPPFDVRPGRSALNEAINQLYTLKEFGRRRPGFAVVYSAAQARQAIARGRIATVPAIEGGEGILEVDDVDRLWVAGARAITLEHFGNNAMGGAAKGQMVRNILGVKTATLEPLGLTELGRAAVERMMDLGIVIDLAHASDALSRDVLDLTEARGVPVLNSHSGARALLQMERAVPDELAARIVKGGGLVGVTVFDRMVTDVPEAARWQGFVPGTCDEVVAHWLHLAKVTGPEGLVLGSDFNGFITRHPPGGSCPNGIRNAGDLPELWAALIAHGVPREALDGMGEKFLTLIETVESKAKPAARSAARHVRRIDPDLFAAP